MYIEVLHDTDGNIISCYCADTLPTKEGAPLFTIEGGPPAGMQQARLNIDTITAMEIDAACGQKAVIDPATGQPTIVRIDRAEHIMKTFQVDMTGTVPGANLPEGIFMRGMVRR